MEKLTSLEGLFYENIYSIFVNPNYLFGPFRKSYEQRRAP